MNEQLEFSFMDQKSVMIDIDYFLTEIKRIYTPNNHKKIKNNLSSCLEISTLTAEQNRRIIQYQSILNTLDLD